MKKRYIYILLITILVFTAIYISKGNDKTFKIGDIQYAVSVDGAKQNSFPEKGTYEVTVSCVSATGKWNYHEWVAEISNVTGNVSCNIDFTSKTGGTLASYISNLIPSGSTSVSASTKETDDGSTLELLNNTLTAAINGAAATATEYRYRGINPNNYIWFNDELWRIIGVFDQYTHGHTGQMLVKIIRNDSIGGYVWSNDTTVNANGSNNYPNSNIYNLLNDAYYNSNDGTNKAYCYNYTTTLTGKCDFTGSGIKEMYRNMVEPSTWYLGGNQSPPASVTMYRYERATTVSTTYFYSGNAQNVTDTNIGLMYVTDYGFGVPSTCTSAPSAQQGAGCANSNWLKSNYLEWTIGHNPKTAYSVLYINYTGAVAYANANLGYDVRPTLYLDPSVYYIGGDGSKTNPYVIDMD